MILNNHEQTSVVRVCFTWKHENQGRINDHSKGHVGEIRVDSRMSHGLLKFRLIFLSKENVLLVTIAR